MMPTRKSLQTDLPIGLVEKIDSMAQILDRPSGSIIEEALQLWVAREEEQRRKTFEALADVDAGRTIDHADVKAWAESLGTAKPLPLPTPR